MTKTMSVVEALYGKEDGAKLEALNAKFIESLSAIAAKYNVKLLEVHRQYSTYKDESGRTYIDKTDVASPVLYAEILQAYREVFGG